MLAVVLLCTSPSAGPHVQAPGQTDADHYTRYELIAPARLAERAHPDREIVYFLQPPETHAFDRYHDYTESRAGVGRYLNIVHAGSTVSNPSARYTVQGDTHLWDRAFGRPANAIALPAGWALANSSVPATVSRTAEGRVGLDFVNPRNDDIAVVVTAVRR